MPPPSGDHPVPFHRATFLTDTPPADVMWPHANSSRPFPRSHTANDRTMSLPTIPPPGDAQIVPSHAAIPHVGVEPACQMPPPATSMGPPPASNTARV